MNQGTQSEPGRLHRIATRQWTLEKFLAIAALAALLSAAILLLFLAPGFYDHYSEFSLPVIAIATITAVIIYDIRYRTPLLDAIPLVQDMAGLRKLYHSHANWSGVSRAFLKHGHIAPFAGQTCLIFDYACSRKRPALRATPLEVPFEPVSFSDPLDRHLELMSSTQHAAPHRHAWERFTKKLRSSRKLQIAIISIAFCINLLLVIPYTGLFSLTTLYLLGFWLMLDAGLRHLDQKMNPCLIPAGLYFRVPSQAHKDLFYFPRRDCFTIIHSGLGNSSCTIFVMNTQTRVWRFFKLPSYQLEIFLSAWLSPLPTPTLEDLSDFA